MKAIVHVASVLGCAALVAWSACVAAAALTAGDLPTAGWAGVAIACATLALWLLLDPPWPDIRA